MFLNIDKTMEKKLEFLMNYFDLLVSEGTLQMGTITPTDCEYIIGELDKIEQENRVREFAS